MQQIKATYRIVTPMFLGGANQDPSDGIRPPSVKGALRFWWRALNWGQFRDVGPDDVSALKELHKEEARLFGIAANDDGSGGQGCFLLTVKHNPITPSQPDIPRFSAYLAGMGLANRRALPANDNFGIVLRFRPQSDQPTRDSVNEVLRLFGLLGGLGSRSRRGFGSVVGLVQDDDAWRPPTEAELDENCVWLKTKFTGLAGSTSPFSALDASSLIYRSKSDYYSAEQAMEDAGKLMSQYRTNGTAIIRHRDGRVIRTAPAGQRIVGSGTVPITSLPFFPTDHTHVYAIAASGNVVPPHNVPPERSIFGLPHPYRFSSLNGTKASFDFVPSWQRGNTKGRRASPLLVHIAAFTDGQGQVRYRPLLLLLPARFLPANAQLDVSVNGTNVGQVPSPASYRTIHNFLSASFTAC